MDNEIIALYLGSRKWYCTHEGVLQVFSVIVWILFVAMERGLRNGQMGFEIDAAGASFEGLYKALLAGYMQCDKCCSALSWQQGVSCSAQLLLACPQKHFVVNVINGAASCDLQLQGQWN